MASPPEEYAPAHHYSESFNQFLSPQQAPVKSILKPRFSTRDSKLLDEKEKLKNQFKQRYSEQSPEMKNKLGSSPQGRVTLNMSPEVVDVSNWKDYNLHESLDVKIQELEAEYKGKKSFGILFKECCL